MTEERPRARILSVGHELLLGLLVDTNAPYIARALAALGLRVDAKSVVGDDEDDIAEAVAMSAAGARVVVVTGGLGPTRDDLTRHG